MVITFHVRVPPTPYYPIVDGYQALPIDPWGNLPTACLGDTLTFTGAPDMTSYTWSTGSTDPSITWPVTGPFGVQLTAIDGDGLSWTNCALDLVNVHLPTELASTVGDTVPCGTLFTVQLGIPPYPSAFGWYHNGQQFSGPTFEYTSTTWVLGMHEYAVRLVDNVGCTIWTNTVSIYTAPTVPPVISQVGPDLVLDHGTINLAWYYNGEPIPNQNQLVWPNAQPGCYWIYAYDCAPVYSDTFCVVSTSIAEAEAGMYQLFPQPVTDHLRLRPLPPPHTPVDVYDATGRAVLRASAAAFAEGLPVHGLAPGAYTLVLHAGQQVVLRFVREP